jgi:diacylglycerol kinase (ATP)
MLPAVIIVNQRRVRDPAGFRDQSRRVAAAHGWQPGFAATTPADPGEGLARAAIAAGARLVVAVGGDGTVRACAQAVAGTGVPLAIVPAGTGNLAARALGLPAGRRGALEVAFGGAARPVDLAVAGELPFLSMAGIGLDAAVVAATPQRLKERIGWLAYAVTGVTSLPGRRHAFTVCLDGGPPLACLARSVVVGNAGLLPGGFTLLPAARLDDGLLDVGILAPASPLGWALVAGRVLARSRRDGPALERFRARRVEITAEIPLPRQADGEVLRPSRSLAAGLAGRLTVHAPRLG